MSCNGRLEKSMAAVLKFPLEKVSRTSKQNVDGKEAKILLFEGVQYDAPSSPEQKTAKLDKA